MMNVGRPTLFSLVLVGALFVGCTSNKSESPAPGTSAASAAKVVNLAIWSNYISKDYLEEFEKQSGIKVIVSNYSSNEELLGKLQAGATGYDVAVPSDYMVFVMAKLGLLTELDQKKISHFSDIEANASGAEYDPKNQYSIPYGRGLTGIAYNKEVVKDPIQSWKDLFENEKYSGRISLLDDVRESIGAALKWKGHSINSIDSTELAEAKGILVSARKRIKAFNSEPVPLLLSGEVVLAHAYSSDALKARKLSAGKIEFVIPKEGASQWVDCLVIPKGSPHQDQAHQLINFFLQARVAASRTEFFFVSPVIKGVKALLPIALQNDPVLFPPPTRWKDFESAHDLGEKGVDWDRVWTEVKASVGA
jgi:spermidine/putrescine transport system substrate-binding protein